MRRGFLLDLVPSKIKRKQSVGSLDGENAAARKHHNNNLLSIDKFKQHILASVELNQITIIEGPTGCGKSSKVPMMVFDELNMAVVCTQPRRLAAVALAKRVAEQRQTILGGEEVGYHIGQRRVAKHTTGIIFSTAGILLEDLLSNGLTELADKCIILDEVHERSVESDLVVACLRVLIKKLKGQDKLNFRLIIMSATMDVKKYMKYFSCSEKNIVKIPHELSTFRPTQELYLESILDMIDSPEDHFNILLGFKLDLGKSSELEKKIDIELFCLVEKLIEWINRNSNDCTSILVFIPTYRHLEMAMNFLQNSSLNIHLYALHSSVDVEQCLESIDDSSKQQNAKIFRRSVILSSNISESSLTILKCGHVIDLCRTVELSWNNTKEKYDSRIVWCSKSQSNQRKGRTGRTCDGFVYRLVPAKLYEKFNYFEKPQLLLSSLRNETLSLLCCTNTTLQVHSVYNKCMDPPPPNKVNAALAHLERIGACIVNRKSQRQQVNPTCVGEMLAQIPYELESAQLILTGAQHGVLYECILIAGILNNSPFPVAQEIGKGAHGDGMGDALFASLKTENLKKFGKEQTKDAVKEKTYTLLANLAAIVLYTHVFARNRRWYQLFERRRVEECTPFWQISDKEKRWCRQHHLVPDSIQSILNQTDIVIGVLHTFRPDFIHCIYESNIYYCGHTVNSKNKAIDPMTVNTSVARYHQCDISSNGEVGCDDSKFLVCTSRYCEFATEVSLSRQSKLKEILFDMFKEKSSALSNGNFPNSAVACAFFLMGKCSNSAKTCKNVHSYDSPRPKCRFGVKCQYGMSCMFRHPEAEQHNSSNVLDPSFEWIYHRSTLSISQRSLSLAPNVAKFTLTLLKDMSKCTSIKFILLGDGDFGFGLSLTEIVTSNFHLAITSYTTKSETVGIYGNERMEARLKLIESMCSYNDNIGIHFSVDATKLRDAQYDIIFKSNEQLQEAYIMWLLPFSGEEGADYSNELVLQRLFQEISMRICWILGKKIHAPPKLLLGLCNNQMQRWNVLFHARQFCLFLTKSWPFEMESFRYYEPRRNFGSETFDCKNMVIYQFEFCPLLK